MKCAVHAESLMVDETLWIEQELDGYGSSLWLPYCLLERRW